MFEGCQGLANVNTYWSYNDFLLEVFEYEHQHNKFATTLNCP